MKLLIDMNLSPRWVQIFQEQGWDAVHWTEVGDARATDATIMYWAREHGFIVFTHDLDFGIILALTRALGPSVIQVRTQDVMPSVLGERVIGILRKYKAKLEKGALLTVDERKARVRILPINA